MHTRSWEVNDLLQGAKVSELSRDSAHKERKDNENDDLPSNTHTNKADIRLQWCVFAALQNTAAEKNNQPVKITTYMWLLFLQLLSDKQLGLLLISSSL